MSLAGRVCVVTGASRGLGRSIATHLAQQGASLALCARDGGALAALAEELRARCGVPVHTRAVDVRDRDAMGEFARSTRDALDDAFGLITNAGVLGPVGSIDATDPDAWQHTLEVNVLGVVHTLQAFLPQMLAQGEGVVLNVLGGGVGGNGVQSFIDAYVASKAAIAVLTETTAQELLPRGVRVNAFSPGPVSTELMRPVLDAGPDGAGEALFAATRAMYDGTVGETLDPGVFELVDFLLSDEADGITGRLLSARWNPVARLRDEIGEMSDPARYRLRRIDAELFLARDELPAVEHEP